MYLGANMNKAAWPWVGEPEKEMGSMAPCGDSSRDINMGDTPRYDAMVAHKHTMPDEAIPQGYAGGMFSPGRDTIDEVEEDEAQALEELAKKFLDLLGEGSTILSIGAKSQSAADAFLKDGHNLISLSKNADNKINTKGFHQEYGSPMFHSFRNKIDAFYFVNQNLKKSSMKISLKNINNQMKSQGFGLIVSYGSDNLSSILEESGFKVIKKHSGKFKKYLVYKNDLNKFAVARYYDEKSNHASIVFRCDVAKTSKEKIDGLQVYSKLHKECGLLFPYKRPTDVFYHMGSVSYPIDIVFIDEGSRIKKICRNVQPGSLEVYGCAGVKHVLEMAGGMCSSLGIKESGLFYINYGKSFEGELRKLSGTLEGIGIDRPIFKRSNKLTSGFYNILNNKIYVLNNNDNDCSDLGSIIKRASLSPEGSKVITGFDIDSIFGENNFKIKLYKHSKPDEDSHIRRGLFNESFSIDKKSFIEVDFKRFVSKDFYKNANLKYSFIPGYSFSEKLSDSQDKALHRIYEVSKNKNNFIVLASREDCDKLLLENFIEKEIETRFHVKASVNCDLIQVPESFGTEEVFSAIKEKYAGQEVELYSSTLIKSAGIPVPDDVKEKARHALRYFKRSSDMCDSLVEKFNKNLEAYKKVEGNADVIKKSKGRYNESCKRNSRIAKRMLINIKNGIKILNEIKDVSTTSEVISSIAESAKNSSEAIKAVFDLINLLDSDEFSAKCVEKTEEAESSLEDAKLTLNRTREYINSDILGILILTE
jgi:uncharacterized membrane protein (UPF0127 family)